MPDKLFFFSSHLYDKEDEYEFYPGSGLEDALYESQAAYAPMRTRGHAQAHAVTPAHTHAHTTKCAGLSKHSPELALCTRSAVRLLLGLAREEMTTFGFHWILRHSVAMRKLLLGPLLTESHSCESQACKLRQLARCAAVAPASQGLACTIGVIVRTIQHTTSPVASQGLACAN